MQTNIPRKINTGMWVLTGDKQVGILTAIGDVAGVDLVGADGVTTLAVQMPFVSLRQAKLEDIPESRRPAPDFAVQLGYV